LTKLKHAWDLYSAIPVVTLSEQTLEANNLLGGSFHEIREVKRILADTKLAEFYQVKLQFKDLKNMLSIA
jgi:hypothetical protein